MLTAGPEQKPIELPRPLGADVSYGAATMFIAGASLSVTELREFMDGFGRGIPDSEVEGAVQFLAAQKLSIVEFRDWCSNYREASVGVKVVALAGHLLSRDGLLSFLSAFPGL